MKILSTLMILIEYSLVLNCGMNTHSEVAFRAYKKFTNTEYQDLITRNPTYFQAGSPFPDWGYFCDYGAVGEATHWPPFIKLYVKYVRDNYKKGDPRYEQLVSFLLGIESHSIADILWHWGRNITSADSTDQGFLHSMGHEASDCNDDWQNCHSYGDVGADFYVSYRGSLRRVANTWDVPVEDIVEMYKLMDFDVPGEVIEGCTFLFYVITHVEFFVAKLELENYEIHTPFLTEEYDQFFVGGVDDMAMNSIWKWENVIDMLEGKVNDYSNSYPNNRSSLAEKRKNTFGKLKNLLLDSNSEKIFRELMGLQSTKHNGDIRFSIDENLLLKNKHIISEIIRQRLYPEKKPLPEYFLLHKQSKLKGSNYSSTVEYSYFGKAMVFGDFNGDGLIDLAIGAPGYGMIQQGGVYLISNYIDNLQNIDYNNPTMIGEEYSRFGYSLATVDLNHDGIDDLAVSAPSSGHNGSLNIDDYYPKEYYGKVFVYFGSKAGLSDKPDITITTSNKDEIFFNMGYFLGSGDCDGNGFVDLLIGSPYSQQLGDKRGNAAVFLELKNDTFIENAQFTVSGQNDYAELGYCMACKNNIVSVSSPGSRINNLQAVGSVTGYNLKDRTILFTVQSDQAMSRLGASIDMVGDILAIGASSYNNENKTDNFHNGSVFIFDIQKLLDKKVISVSDNIQRLTLQSYTHRNRFGKFVKFCNDTLYVGGPLYSPLFSADEGRVLVFNNLSQMSGVVSEDTADLILSNYNVGSRFGEYIIVNNSTLIISAPLSSADNFSGMIVEYDL
jgi:glycosylphosphatidylinositol phospholipase D